MRESWQRERFEEIEKKRGVWDVKWKEPLVSSSHSNVCPIFLSISRIPNPFFSFPSHLFSMRHERMSNSLLLCSNHINDKENCFTQWVAFFNFVNRKESGDKWVRSCSPSTGSDPIVTVTFDYSSYCSCFADDDAGRTHGSFKSLRRRRWVREERKKPRGIRELSAACASHR